MVAGSADDVANFPAATPSLFRILAEIHRHRLFSVWRNGVGFPKDGNVLLRSLVTKDPTGQGLQPHPLASGQRDAPQMRLDPHLALLPPSAYLGAPTDVSCLVRQHRSVQRAGRACATRPVGDSLV